jgi:hypothetical protein
MEGHLFGEARMTREQVTAIIAPLVSTGSVDALVEFFMASTSAAADGAISDATKKQREDWRRRKHVQRMSQDVHVTKTLYSGVSGDQISDPESTVTGQSRDISEAFSKFWAAYPKRKAKSAAIKAWAKASKEIGEADLLRRCLDALAWQTISPEWRKESGAFIPHPATWINSGRYDDERPAPPRPTTFDPYARAPVVGGR